MKKILIAITLIGSTAMACSPPSPDYPAYYIQKGFIYQLLGSKKVDQAIVSQGLNVYIKAILPQDEFQIQLSNGCALKIGTDWEDPSPGACPELTPLIVREVKCEK